MQYLTSPRYLLFYLQLSLPFLFDIDIKRRFFSFEAILLLRCPPFPQNIATAIVSSAGTFRTSDVQFIYLVCDVYYFFAVYIGMQHSIEFCGFYLQIFQSDLQQNCNQSGFEQRHRQHIIYLKVEWNTITLRYIRFIYSSSFFFQFTDLILTMNLTEL